ncbi:diaminopimelate epimerase [Larsenimonas rhizosphaerae]|uniref:diaminopimelate epimerase n=1 Tax=Larsenimonas rhizosphaerae TaxID=2944682 RepID=UPI002033DF61|nr:diaminopimelate epimerase [Larsenimonas rhizosphaerae]MCM2131502.1 diaminopimelate epimerase [Larsenimonas rhizosphaerae]
MLLRFWKMHGLGNDFMVVDLVTQRARLPAQKISEWANRHTGIGFDQLLLVEPPTHPDMDFRYRIFNADGSEVENCGNGARCFARFVVDNQLTAKRDIRVETAGGPMLLSLTDDARVRVDMGPPRLAPAEIPFHAEMQSLSYEVETEQGTVSLSAISMGNPHAVVMVDSVDTAPVTTLGPLLERHHRFPRRVNVGFLEVLSTQHARLRVFERGVGETRACGTGACAAAVAGIQQGVLESPVNIDLPGGQLTLEWAGEGHSVIMTGPAERVFEGRIPL